jgi:hypothetical protein
MINDLLEAIEMENSENIISKVHRFRIKPSSVEPTSSPERVEFKSIKEKHIVIKT